MGAITILLYICMIATIIPGVTSYEYCSGFKYCEDGYYCCEYDTKCCSDNIFTIGAIIGLVIGCIVFIGCIVAVICCVIKQSHRSGQVIQPVQQPGVAVITTGQQQGPPGYCQHGYGQPMYGQPPMYGHQPFAQQQFGAQPPPFGEKAGTSNPAYPPPPPSNY